LEQFVEKNQLQERIIFYGTKTSEEILKLLRKSKIFGFTSLKEALPTVLVEAMFCSNAIISYNCNYGSSDIVKNNSGFLIDVNNKEDFIQKLEMLTNSDEKLEKMMESASKEAQNWKQNEILKKWQEII
jgi:glycosyltransferase involved in cell wall biosynthesis